MCSMLLQHIVPVLIISPYPFNGKQKCGELACVISAGDVEPLLAMSSQEDPEARVLYGSLGEN